MDNRSGWSTLSRGGGQGMTEYIIIVALIAIAAVGVYSFFGNPRPAVVTTLQDPSIKQEKAAMQPVVPAQPPLKPAEAGSAGDGKSAPGGK